MEPGTDSRPELLPHLQLDELLAELQGRLRAVLATRDRMRGLLEAVVAIGSGLDLESTLRRIAETAVGLVDASYGALGVIGEDGRLAEFIPVGLSPHEIEAIHHWPEGRGLLGLLIDDPRPLRLDDIAAHRPSTASAPRTPRSTRSRTRSPAAAGCSPGAAATSMSTWCRGAGPTCSSRPQAGRWTRRRRPRRRGGNTCPGDQPGRPGNDDRRRPGNLHRLRHRPRPGRSGRPGHHGHQESRLPAARADALRSTLPSKSMRKVADEMADIEGSRSFGITGDAMWAVVADPARLADWVPTMRRAEPAGDAEVHLEGESHGHRYSLDSSLRTDQADRSLHWGAAADEGYRGWLQVVDRPSGSEVRIHVAVPDDRLGPSADAAAAEIRRGLEEAFDRLASLIVT